MSKDFGEVPAGAVLPIYFASYGKTNGESITLTGLAVTDIEIYKNGATTQRSSDAGYALLDTDGIDFDGITGIHGFSIDLSDNTDASFYAVGSFYWVIVSAVTIDSQTVNFIAATFRIVAAEAIAGKPKVDVDAFGGTAGTFSSGRPEVNATHAAGTAWGSGAITAASIATNAFTAAKFAAGAFDAVWTVSVRVLTANTNLNDLSAAGIRTAIGLGSANLDTQLTGISAKTGLIPGTIDGKTFAEIVTLVSAVLLGKASGMGTTTGVFRNMADTKDRVTATIDADGNRSAITLDAT